MRLIAGIVALAAAPALVQAQEPLRGDALKLFGRVEAPLASVVSTPEVQLGRKLFWDTRVSLDGKTACASCHLTENWGADPRKFSVDAKGLNTSRHSPTVFNSMTQPALRWLGDRKTGADQAEGSLVGSMGFASKQVGLEKLKELGYGDDFKAAYPSEPEAMNPVNYGKALAAYQSTLTTPAPFDRFLAGDDNALTAAQKEGLRTFMVTGCTACHTGPLLGGAKTMKFGLVRDYWLETGSEKPDQGRYAITKKDEDKYVFRVPMLRNVAKTAPYFHDGSVDTLDRAVRVMGATQLGRQLDEATVASIVAFLDSLTGEVPAHYSQPR